MCNGAGLFQPRGELGGVGWFPVASRRCRKGEGEMLPLDVGRMIQHYDHRAANVTVNEDNLHNAALSGAVSGEQKRDPDFVPTPQYWVPSGTEQLSEYSGWAIGFRAIARPPAARTFLAAIPPHCAAGNKLPLLFPNHGFPQYVST